MSAHRLWLIRCWTTYFTEGDGLPQDSPILNRFRPVEEELARLDPSMRMASFEYPLRQDVLTSYGVLHWSNGKNLRTLDQKVSSGTATEEDFAGSVFASPRERMCLSCRTWHRTLYVHGDDYDFGPFDRGELRHHKLDDKCTACGRYMPGVVANFGPTEEDSSPPSRE